MNMNALTWVVVIYLALVVFRAVRRGFLRSVFSMAFLLVVVLVMAVGTPAVTKMCSESQYITEYVRKQTAAVIASTGSGSGSSVSLANASTPEEVGTAVIALAMGTDSVRDAAAGEIGSVIIRIIAAVITFVIALLIGGIFLLTMRVIRIRIPGSYLGCFAVLTLITAIVRGYQDPVLYTLQQLCAGGLMLGAWFMATDYVTSPITARGQIVFGCALGFLTWVFRLIGSGAEGVSYSIIFMNLLVPVIEQYTRPVAAGMVRLNRENRRLMRQKKKEARRLKAAGKKEKDA